MFKNSLWMVCLLSTFCVQAESPLMQEIKALAAEGYDFNKPDEHGLVELYKAAMHADIEAAKYLIKAGANVSIRDNTGCDAFYYAFLGRMYSTQNAAAEVIKLLIEAGADANTVLLDGSSLLTYSVKSGSIDIVKVLLAHGVEINYQDNNKCTALFCAVGKGDKELVELLLQAGADTNIKNTEQEFSALYIAVHQGFEEISSLLIEAGADVNAITSYGANILNIAVAKNAMTTVKMLLVHGAHATYHSPTTEFTALHLAIGHNNKEMVEMLLQAGADPNAPCQWGWTSLHDVKDVEICALLLAAGADVNYPSKGYASPLEMMVCDDKRLDIVKLLISHNAFVNYQAPHYKGSSVLHTAAKYGAIESAKLLLAAGADISLKDNDGYTAADIAAQAGHAKLAYMLSPTFLSGSLRYIRANAAL